MKFKKYTDEEIELAKSKSILDVAEDFGFTLVKQGKVYSTKQVSSLKLFPHNNSYYRYSTKTAGNVINFVREFSNYNSFQEAMEYLIGSNRESFKNEIRDFKNIEIKELPKGEFILPERNKDMKRVYSYLINTRKISKKVIDKCVKQKLIRQDIHNNVMFIGYDEYGVEKYCSLTGTLSNVRWKGEVPESNKYYGFKLMKENTDTLLVFESPIDLLSAETILEDNKIENNFSYVSLGGLSTMALDKIIENNKDIKKIGLMLDNDEKGKETTEKILNEYKEYNIKDFSHLYNKYKDVNEYLISKRELELNQNEYVNSEIEIE